MRKFRHFQKEFLLIPCLTAFVFLAISFFQAATGLNPHTHAIEQRYQGDAQAQGSVENTSTGTSTAPGSAASNSTSTTGGTTGTTGDRSNDSVFKEGKDDPGKDELGKVIKSALNKVMGFAGIILLIMVLIGGVMYIVSAGNPTATGLAKKTIVGSIIGLIIIISSYLVISLLAGLFK
ncbi:MAG: hypothetical protein Q7S53_00370 [bacterium]|nr:hypothetical protein [bacterium]